jgi:hypothetical protein
LQFSETEFLGEKQQSRRSLSCDFDFAICGERIRKRAEKQRREALRLAAKGRETLQEAYIIDAKTGEIVKHTYNIYRSVSRMAAAQNKMLKKKNRRKRGNTG